MSQHLYQVLHEVFRHLLKHLQSVIQLLTGMSGKELYGLIRCCWSQRGRQDRTTLSFNQSPSTDAPLNQGPCLFQESSTLSKNERYTQFSPGQKKANIHYADKQREARMIISCRGGKLGNSCSSLLMIHHLAYGSGYMPAIPMSSFCSIFILLCWDSFAASIGAAHCSQYPSLSDLAAPSSLKATHANFVVSEFTRTRCLVGRKGISDRGFDGHHRA